MDKKLQKQTPYLDAVKNYLKEKNVCFDVPGHHQKKIKTDLNSIYSNKIYEGDINCPYGLDNILDPRGVIKQAQDLMADATGAKSCRFLINGSSSGIQIMIMSTIKANEKIILPRNVHKSVINALILSGAKPIFLMPKIDESCEIVNQNSFEDWKKIIDENPDAKAIFIINPTYFGATCELKRITSYAHKKNMLVLVDEAHGSHFYFGKNLPITAMKAGADLATLSLHKTGGSLTQSSILLRGTDNVSDYLINKTFNIITCTSPSTILLSSLEAARKHMVFKGKKEIENAVNLCSYARKEIKNIKGFIPLDKERFIKNGAYDVDPTKLVVEIDKLKLTGNELYVLLKNKYHIQIELAETYAFLCIFSIGNYQSDVDTLINALKDISKDYYDESLFYIERKYFNDFPDYYCRPREAFQAPMKTVHYKDALNCISKEMVMIYPPGIPFIIPGEVFTQDVIDHLKYLESINVRFISDHKDGYISVIDTDNWILKKEEIDN